MRKIRLFIGCDMTFATASEFTDADETHILSLDGEAVELDLTAAWAARLREVVGPYLKAGHEPGAQPEPPEEKPPGRERLAGQGRRRELPGTRVFYRGMREYAAEQGIKVPEAASGGRVRHSYSYPEGLRERYVAHLRALVAAGHAEAVPMLAYARTLGMPGAGQLRRGNRAARRLVDYSGSMMLSYPVVPRERTGAHAMTTMTAEAAPGQARSGNADVARPTSGIQLEPGRLRQWMTIPEPVSPAELSARISEMGLIPWRHASKHAGGHAVVPDEGRKACTACGEAIAPGLTADAIIKIANGTRKPKARSLRAICGALGIRPGDLMPGSEPPDPDAEARRRVADFNQGMRDFANAIGRPELYQRPPGPDGKARIRYTAELRALYTEWLASEDARPVPLAS